MDILFDEEGGIVTESAIYVALCKQIEILFGDYGMAAAKLSLSVKVYLLVSLLKVRSQKIIYQNCFLNIYRCYISCLLPL